MNNEKINISKSEYNFYLSVNPNKKDILKNKECIDNKCLMVYKIKDMNLNGGRRKTLKRRP